MGDNGNLPSLSIGLRCQIFKNRRTPNPEGDSPQRRREREGQNGFGELAESGASQDADVAGSSFGGFVVSANCPAGFGSAIAPIREPFLNWFR